MKRLLIIFLLLSSVALTFAADYEVPAGGAQEGTNVGFGNITATSLQVGEGSSAAPSIDIGGGDDGFFLSAGTLRYSISGSATNDLVLGVSGIQSTNSAGAFVLTAEVATATNPVFSFLQDTDTGIGKAAADQLSLIAGGVEGIRVDGSGYEATSGQVNATAILPIYSTTGTTAATDLLINRIETSVGSGDQNLIDAQVGTVSKFKVTHAGSTHIMGSLNIYNGTTVFTNYSVTAQDYTIFANATTTGTDMYLPDATTVEGMHARFKKKDSTDSHITINAVGGQTIDGVTTKVLEQTNNAIMVYSDGSNWEVLQATSVAHFGEMHAHDNSTATVINTAAIPHLMQGLFSEEDSEGFLFALGSTGPISAFAEYSTVVSGTTQVTDVGHGLSSGAILSISGTTSYNGIFEATVIDSDNYYIVDTFVADDATGNWYEGDSLINNTGKSAKYMIDFNGFGTPETNNDVLSFHLYKGAVNLESLESKRKFTSSTDVGSITASGLVTLADGDTVTFGIINTAGTGDFTMEHVNVVIHSF